MIVSVFSRCEDKLENPYEVLNTRPDPVQAQDEY